MAKKKFRVGQVWEDRLGTPWRIVSLTDGTIKCHPLKAVFFNVATYNRLDGTHCSPGCDCDLIKQRKTRTRK